MKQTAFPLLAQPDAAAFAAIRTLTPEEMALIGGGIEVDEYPLPPRG